MLTPGVFIGTPLNATISCGWWLALFMRHNSRVLPNGLYSIKSAGEFLMSPPDGEWSMTNEHLLLTGVSNFWWEFEEWGLCLILQ
jgi:hypothetical protein